MLRGYENCQKAIFDGDGEFGIPPILPVNQLPGLEGWTEFNKALSCRRCDNKGVHFFIDDYQFERVWQKPDMYIQRLREFACVCSPDFSPYSDFPRAIQIYNHYRKHWLAAYWQEHGITVIPTITWSSPDTLDFIFDGEPVGGIVALSSVGMFDTKEHTRWFMEGYHAMMDLLEPTAIYWKGKVPEEIHNDTIIRIDEHVSKWRRKGAGADVQATSVL